MRRRSSKALQLIGYLGLLLFLALALAQEESATPLSSLKFTRETRTIIINQYAPGSEGGEFRTNAPNCTEESNLRTSTVFAPSPYLVETLVNDTKITSNIALRKSPPKDQGGTDKTVLELFGGKLEVSQETLCPENISLSEEADVTLSQGRTSILGQRFDYDNDTGIGKMTGPIDLSRQAEGDAPSLSATANELEYNEETDSSVLRGNVRVESDGRISEADSLDYDEKTSIAILKGSPATSRKDNDTLQGETIIYYLDSNDVVVKGNIAGEVEVDLGSNSSFGTNAPADPPELDPEQEPPSETEPPSPEEAF